MWGGGGWGVGTLVLTIVYQACIESIASRPIERPVSLGARDRDDCRVGSTPTDYTLVVRLLERK